MHGPSINTGQTAFCPMVTPDGKYLFFSRGHGATWAETMEAEIFWVDAAVIERFPAVTGGIGSAELSGTTR